MIRILRRRGQPLRSPSLGGIGGSSSSALIFRPTRTNLIPIPPAVWRMISVGGLFLLDAFLRAHRQQVKKMESQDNENGTTRSATGSIQGLPMTAEEAFQILGIESKTVPLLKTKDLDLATQRFYALFEKATLAKSPYLQGKIVAAYETATGSAAPLPEVVSTTEEASSGAPSDDGQSTSSGLPRPPQQ
ncbi:Hypothetical protein, putative [Bodo saltans]|uniref:Transmembrane protein n=1 Tax=Bodo saltans TaxID=75058 RepID=A0A0S4JD45_BODSA|nr:Hypothetical protein, putative [Bodo saltans]|eukprot:CUG88073.1 Hypothetical protein, putative [Bodo saltans]